MLPVDAHLDFYSPLFTCTKVLDEIIMTCIERIIWKQSLLIYTEKRVFKCYRNWHRGALKSELYFGGQNQQYLVISGSAAVGSAHMQL